MMSVFDGLLPADEGLLSEAAAAIARVKMVGMNAPTDTTVKLDRTKLRRVRTAIGEPSFLTVTGEWGDGPNPLSPFPRREGGTMAESMASKLPFPQREGAGG